MEQNLFFCSEFSDHYCHHQGFCEGSHHGFCKTRFTTQTTSSLVAKLETGKIFWKRKKALFTVEEISWRKLYNKCCTVRCGLSGWVSSLQDFPGLLASHLRAFPSKENALVHSFKNMCTYVRIRVHSSHTSECNKSQFSN